MIFDLYLASRSSETLSISKLGSSSVFAAHNPIIVLLSFVFFNKNLMALPIQHLSQGQDFIYLLVDPLLGERPRQIVPKVN